MYDGENATEVMLGVFNGSHPPPKEGIYSSSNHMFLIFRSDKNGSYTGFKASYYGFNISGESYYFCDLDSEDSVADMCVKHNIWSG